MLRHALCAALAAGCTAVAGADPAPAAGPADENGAGGSGSSEAWSLHGQFTTVAQYHPSFTSPYRGTNSLDPGNSGRETVDLTLYAGVRVWSGGAFYVNPEIDQGFGLSTTLGLGGFSSGEAYKVGVANPYFRLPRYFLRQVFDLGGNDVAPESDANQVADRQASENVTLTAGKFSAVDLFDTNRYAHDPRTDFMNWAVIDSGAYDYAADSWGYTYGVAAEWTQAWWTLRAGSFALSRVPNERTLDRSFKQFELVAEAEERHAWSGHPGKLRLLAFNNRGRMGGYDAALDLPLPAGALPSTAAVRRMASRPGVALNFEQEVVPDLGVFARASVNDGTKEAYEFTEINRSLAAGVSLAGDRWSRAQDTVGAAFVVNGLSSAARRYFAAGGMGILIGDGRLPDCRFEKIVETYYALRLTAHLALSVDYQYVVNPAYNADRGPVSIFGVRIHAQM